MIHAMPVTKPNVFNIPASAPFLPALVDALHAGKLVPGFPATRDPLELARATLYLPTRRACRLARDVFLDRLDGDAAILPRIVALGDLDEDEIAFAQAATGELAVSALALPEALSGLDRAMPLAALILRWAETIAPRQRGHASLVANNPVTALALAQDLARLMDDMTTRQVSWEKLDGLVPDEFDKYWELTLNFLKFIRTQWPLYLTEQGRMEPAERRDALIKAEVARLRTTPGPVIAAGSTGSIPATAELLATIASLPHGALVLPGLDTDLDDATWSTIADDAEHSHGHPQFAMANCGWPWLCSASSAIVDQVASSRSVSRPGSTSAPCGRLAMVASSSAVAGIEPVEPAAITGPGVVRSRATSALISASRRSAGSMRPCSVR